MATQADLWPLIENTWLGTEGALDGLRIVLKQASSLNPGYAMRAATFLGQLQSVTAEPYPSFVNDAPTVPSCHPILAEVSKYWLFAVLVYPPSLLRRNYITLAEGVNDSEPIGTMLLKNDPALEMILGQRSTCQGCPAFLLAADHIAETAVLAIRGSLEVADWAININCKMSDEGYHCGMWQAAEALDYKVRDVLTTFFETRPMWTLVLTGHSLGAGVASFLTVRWLKYRPLNLKVLPKIHCYAFGSPSGATETARAACEDSITHVVYGRDCVPKCNLHSLQTLLLRLNSIAETMRAEDDMLLETSSIAISLFKNLFPSVLPIQSSPILNFALPIGLIRDHLEDMAAKQSEAWRESGGFNENKIATILKRLFTAATGTILSSSIPPDSDFESIPIHTPSYRRQSTYPDPTLKTRTRRAFGEIISTSDGTTPEPAESWAGDHRAVRSRSRSFECTPKQSSGNSIKGRRSDSLVRTTSEPDSSETQCPPDRRSGGGVDSPALSACCSPQNYTPGGDHREDKETVWWSETLSEDQQTIIESALHCLSEIRSREDKAYPLGRVLCVVPRAHYIAYGLPPPDKSMYNECYIYQGTHATLPVNDEFIVAIESIADHFLNKYCYAFCPQLLSQNPTNLPAKRRHSVTEYVKVGVADRSVTVAGTAAYLTIGHRLPDFLVAFRSVRPLIVKLTLLPPRRAYQAFKFLARLQRCVGSPYLPPLEKGTPMKFDDPLVKKLSFYVKFAVGVYPQDVLDKHGIRRPAKSGTALEDQILKTVPKTTLLAKREIAEPTKPAYLLVSSASTCEVILAIQGSTSYSDWVTNLVCNPGTDTGHHMGMHESAENTDLEIRSVLLAYLTAHPSYNVVLTGHSLGGGVATLLAIRWVNMLPIELQRRVFAYSFGSPCVVPQEQAIMYQDRVFSVIFGRDLIARLSYGSVRDLLLTLHALSNVKNSASRKLKYVYQDEASKAVTIPGQNNDMSLENQYYDGDESDGASDREVDKLDSEAIPPILNESETVDDTISIISTPALLQTGRSRRKQIRADIADARVTLPASYRDLRKLVKARSEAIDNKINEYRVKRKRRSLFSYLFRRPKVPSVPPNNDISIEHNVLRRCLEAVTAISICPADEMLVPAGQCVMIIPELHLLEHNLYLKNWIQRGQCALIKFDTRTIVDVLKEPIWSLDAVVDHSINCYYQGLAPELLHYLPEHTSIIPSKTRGLVTAAGFWNRSSVPRPIKLSSKIVRALSPKSLGKTLSPNSIGKALNHCLSPQKIRSPILLQGKDPITPVHVAQKRPNTEATSATTVDAAETRCTMNWENS